MDEEVGLPGLRERCARHSSLLMADALIASDDTAPCTRAANPFPRYARSCDLCSSNRGLQRRPSFGKPGRLPVPAIQLAHALSTILSPTGRIRMDAWVARKIPAGVHRALSEWVAWRHLRGQVLIPNGKTQAVARGAGLRLLLVRRACHESWGSCGARECRPLRPGRVASSAS